VIDLNCHALPGREGDGPADEAESIALLSALAQEGVEVAAITPYLAQGTPADDLNAIRDELTSLRKAASAAGVPGLIPGAELDLGWALSATDDALKRASLGGLGSTLLVRSPLRGATLDFDDMLLNLTLRGYRVVLAHPESNRGYQDHPRRLARLLREGVLVQIDAGSLNADEKSRARRMALALLHEGGAHVIASNAHGARSGPPGLAAAVEVAEEIAGARARWMVTDAPAAILAGAALPPAPESGGRVRSLFRRGQRHED
jgi:protein-tyrosine phosphatase